MTIELIFARHGETDNNKDGILQGHLDTPLNEKGRMDAQELARNLKDIAFSEIYSSDLARAFNCAEQIQKFFPNLEIKKDHLLEKDFRRPSR